VLIRASDQELSSRQPGSCRPCSPIYVLFVVGGEPQHDRFTVVVDRPHNPNGVARRQLKKRTATCIGLHRGPAIQWTFSVAPKLDKVDVSGTVWSCDSHGKMSIVSPGNRLVIGCNRIRKPLDNNAKRTSNAGYECARVHLKISFTIQCLAFLRAIFMWTRAEIGSSRRNLRFIWF
jgi:hypothetical protein